MNLLWRNDIDPDKIVLGTGFYGRAFTATSPNCLSPGCTYESGAPRQPCSGEVSVMLQSEIVDVMDRTGNKPTLDKDAAVKILTFDSNQWVAFDDEDTFKMKADFAREQCMSGIMVWAVSGDVQDGKYSKAIANAAKRKYTSLPAGFFLEQPDDDGYDEEVTKHPQCKWTNCGQMCPSGWIRMKRSDKEARKNEYMVDGSYCSEGVHELCCPPEGDTPTCGWYQHNNGKCDPSCPSGTLEVGSLKKHCSNSKYQAACCTTGGKSMDLYDQCSWTDAPMCMLDHCSSSEDEVARSPTGSGAAVCNIEQWTYYAGEGDVKVQERKYCCDQEDDQKWADCKWYNNLGPGKDDDSYCRSGCPGDRVRVAMDKYDQKDGTWLCSRGARAKCCVPKHATITKRESSADSVLRDALESFIKYPVCSEDGGYWTGDFSKRSVTGDETVESEARSRPKSSKRDAHLAAHTRSFASSGRMHHRHLPREDSQPSQLQTRQSWGNFEQDEVKKLIHLIITGRSTTAQDDIWDDVVTDKYSNLQVGPLTRWVEDTGAAYQYGYEPLAYEIACHMGDFNNWVGEEEGHDCECDSIACCPDGGDWCDVDEGAVPEGENNAVADFSDDGERMMMLAAPPGEGRPYNIVLPDGTVIEIESEPYWPSTHSFWGANHPIWSNVHLYPEKDCLGVYPEVVVHRRGLGGVHAEHIVEQNTIPRFFTHATAGTLPSGRTPRTARISQSLIRTLVGNYNYQPAPMTGGGNSRSPVQRIFNALGSQDNTDHMVFAARGLNFVKGAIWRNATTGGQVGAWWMARNAMQNRMRDLQNFEVFVQNLRDPIVALNYLANADVWGHLLSINNDVRNELERLQIYHRNVANIDDRLVDYWDEFIRDQLQSTVESAVHFVERWVRDARNEYRDDNSDNAINLLARLSTLLRYAREVELWDRLDDLP